MEFSKAKMQQGFGKVGILGFAGSGKTYTAHAIARGVYSLIQSKKPIVCIETETGVDFMVQLYEKAGIDLQVAKTRAFADLMGHNGDGGLMAQSEKIADILVIDSVTHFWTDIVDSYRIKNKLSRLRFQDWGIVKPMWGKFTDFFLKSKLHIIICGRAGYEYDYFEDDEGKMELYKTGTKMKVESEMGYEPSLLIEMERAKISTQKKTRSAKGKEAQQKIQIGQGWTHRAHVLKDRSQMLDGQEFDNPTFEMFIPHFKSLNLGGEHFVETQRDSQDLFKFEGKPNWKVEQEQKEISRAEIKAIIDKYFPGRSDKEKRAKIILKDHVFSIKSDEALDSLDLSTLKIGQEYIEWLLADQDVIVALLEGNEEILKPKKEEWHVFNAEKI